MPCLFDPRISSAPLCQYAFLSSDVPEHALHPCNNFMTRGIRGFVEIDHTGANEGFEVAFERRTSHWYRSEMSGPDEKAVIVLKKQWPIARVHGRSRSFWLDGVVGFFALGKDDCHAGKERCQGYAAARECFLFFGLLEWSDMRCTCCSSCVLRRACFKFLCGKAKF